jgi:hypothetical protein
MMTLIETITVGSGGAASIEFTGIPGNGKDLLLLLSGRSEGGSNFLNTFITFNANSANRSGVVISGDGNSASSFSTTTPYTSTNGNGSTTNTFSNSKFYISNYAGSTAKSFTTEGVSENNATAALQTLSALLWNDTSAITSIQLTNSGGSDHAEHSTASLYIIS